MTEFNQEYFVIIDIGIVMEIVLNIIIYIIDTIRGNNHV